MIPTAVVATTAAALAATVVIHGLVPPGVPAVHPSHAPLQGGHTAIAEPKFINIQIKRSGSLAVMRASSQTGWGTNLRTGDS